MLDAFDGLSAAAALLVSREEMESAWNETEEELKSAMRLAQANIRAFAEKQLPRAWSFRPRQGMEVGQIVRPLESVGCYVPGGRYPLPSTLLMTVTLCPGRRRGAHCGLFTQARARDARGGSPGGHYRVLHGIGGAQAIAAMAYGTVQHEGTIAPVVKIVGPGNLYVTAAKIAVSFETGIAYARGPNRDRCHQ